MLDEDIPLPDPQSAPASAIVEEVEQGIDQDISCIRCGYNLRGTTSAGQCPECGEPVQISLRPDLLHMANPAWLDKLRKGMSWLLAALIINLVMVPVAIAFKMLFITPSAMPYSGIPIGALIALAAPAILISLAYAVGIWLVTEPESVVYDKKTSRRLARWLIVPAMLVGLVADLLHASNDPENMLAGSVIETAGSIMLLVGFLAGLRYLRLLAMRIPETRLVKETMAIFWCMLIVMSLLALTPAGVYLFDHAVAKTTSTGATMGVLSIAGLAVCSLGSASLFFFIWLIILMFHYRTRFKQAHEFALKQQHGGSIHPS